ncbi:GNAT family N-acetyltransferase [Paenibacillus sp. 1011MAR3C5]|uniref:GNAT family N-acetyltransferase n=1 Tax=Paenibacillus sp. 1011MAR3C5 TaxID=1675787 RepID=UPI000E6D5458|nr:GNAT family N-acetyltransferase [Paenibacillus sp. 1011MAR3C5]RJE85540.1 GNAT family N-acetyltransferase [Paenibacillus sp. 1011MAR3C5]
MTIHAMSEVHARSLCDWRYEPPWDSYNWPAWENMKKDAIEFGDPVLRASQYAVVLDKHQSLVGYVQFFPMGNVTRLGLGLHPERIGQGLGSHFVHTLALEALRRCPDHEIDLEVASWNIRAIRAYERAGFRIEDTYLRPSPSGEIECHCMVFHPAGLSVGKD